MKQILMLSMLEFTHKAALNNVIIFYDKVKLNKETNEILFIKNKNVIAKIDLTEEYFTRIFLD